MKYNVAHSGRGKHKIALQKSQLEIKGNIFKVWVMCNMNIELNSQTPDRKIR